MQQAKAYLKNLRISPRKVQIVLDLIRDQQADKALAILKYTNKAACAPLYKLVHSAMANAEHNFNMDTKSLYVAQCFVTQGPTMKRVRPRAQGRAFQILKRSSHVTVVLQEREG